MSKVLLQAHVTPELKKGAKQMALDKGISLSELTHRIFSEAINGHEAAKTRRLMAANYNSSEVPL